MKFPLSNIGKPHCALLFAVPLLLTGQFVAAQVQPAAPLSVNPLVQLQERAPSIEVNSNVTATASFEPPVIRLGEKSTYRVTFNALDDSIRWPADITAPLELDLRMSARGEIFLNVENRLIPQTTINHRVRAAAPGVFTIPQFFVRVYGRRVPVPAARLEVLPADSPATAPGAQLQLEFGATNVFVGQPVNVRVTMSASPANTLEALNQLRFTGGGFLVDGAAARQTIAMTPRDGRRVPMYLYETLLTPLVSGRVTIAAQAFTAGNRFEGPITIQAPVTIPGGPSQYLLVDSDPVTINVQPLPRSGELPGFTGAIGTFTADPPRLLTNRVVVGDKVKLSVAFSGDGNLARLVMPPPPTAPGWQTFPAVPGGLPIANRSPAVATGAAVEFTYTFIPLSSEVRATPPIPFSYFDPKRAAYVNLTIPSVAMTVSPSATPTDWPAGAETNKVAAEERKLTLSALATTPGRTASTFTPLQQRAWFIVVQVFPLLGFAGLWAWDKRRRHLEQHPDILLRRRARRALRRERRALQRALAAGDTTRYAATAVSAMRVACAPHYPAEPRALVCRDVLDLLDESERAGRTGEVIRKIFAFADASSFAAGGAEANGLLKLQPELDRLLERLEARL